MGFFCLIRRRLVPVVGLFLLGNTMGFTASAQDEIFKIENPILESYEDAEDDLFEIENNLEDAQCGGWDFEQSVAGAIPTVEGLPGRHADPLGAIHTGVGVRDESGWHLDDGFFFPAWAWVDGWTTACGDINDLPCENPGECADECVRLNRRQQPTIVCYEGTPFEFTETWDCMDNNNDDPDDPPPGMPGYCRLVHWKYCCTQQIVTQMEYEDCAGNPNECWQHADEHRNCLRCEGDGAQREDDQGDLERDGDGDFVDYHDEKLRRRFTSDQYEYRNETGCRVGRYQTQMGTSDKLWDQTREIEVNGSPTEIEYHRLIPKGYVSFFRQYSANYDRDEIDLVNNDDHSRTNVPVNCYGFYREFDPKLDVAREEDYRCVFDLSGRNHHFDDMDRTQSGVAEFDSGHDDISEDDELRDTYDEDEDLWYQELGPSFSLVNGKKLNDDLETDLTNVLLDLDIGKQKSIVQMTEDEPVSSGFLINAFDDTYADINTQKTMVEWWQRQQTYMNQNFTPQVARLLLPPAWSIDLDPLHPLLSPPDLDSLAQDLNKDTSLQPIEVQLELRDDLLGEVADYLKNSLLLQIQQEKVPVVIPLGSPTELRAIAEGWCHWFRFQNNNADCNDADGDVGDLVRKLREYAFLIDQYRELRTDLSKYAAKYLEYQNTINRELGQWVLQGGQAADYIQSGTVRKLHEDWEEIQRLYREFHDRNNMPWCRNDRFTTPIYSLLDPWLPGRPHLDGKDIDGYEENELPELYGTRFPDLVIDLTHISVASGGLVLPVLEPIQLQIDFATIRPPAETDENPEIPELPDLPDVPTIAEDLENRLEDILVINKPGVPPIPTVSVTQDEEKMERIKELFRQKADNDRGMVATYDKFWDSVRNWDRAPRSRADCDNFDEDPCVHVEMDLIERFTRIGARPAVLLKEELESAGRFTEPHKRGYNCPTDDWTCMQLNPERELSIDGWEVIPPKSDPEAEGSIENLRKEAFEETLLRENVNEEDRIPYSDDLDSVLPAMGIPTETTPKAEIPSQEE